MRESKMLTEWVTDARRRTLVLIADLDDEQLLGPHLAIINPLLWEIGHVAWFAEKWVLRHARGEPPIRADADRLYDSAGVAHDTRWDLALPRRHETLAYMTAVHDRILDQIAAGEPDRDLAYFIKLAVFHEDMHCEAFTYLRQTLAYTAPTLPDLAREPAAGGPLPGDVHIPGDRFLLGAMKDEPFVFDNEKWAHAVDVAQFAIARTPVTQAEFADFVNAGGYRRREFWSDDGWKWRAGAAAEHPVYWQRDGSQWARRDFDRWVKLEPHRPVIHVNAYEADAFCRWAKRRLPTEVEWEMAASWVPTEPWNRRWPWGDAPVDQARANLDGEGLGCAEVGAYSAGDSAVGCRQLIGNVWEWTASTFGPYPGFVADPYKEYSAPWFHTHRVLRGGCWVTRSRLLRNTWRNFYTPDRRDVWAGFRTCPLRG